MAISDDWIALLDGARISTPQAGADIRPSGFPFCGRRYGWRHLIDEEPDTFSVRSDTYTGIGRAVHEVVQASLSRNGRLTRCEEEVHDYVIGLVGHIDGVLDETRVLEIKTAGHSKVLAMRRKSREERELACISDSPWAGYRDQCLTYAALLGLDEAEILLISRDNPATCCSWVLSGAMAHYATIRRRVHNARWQVSLRVLPSPDEGPACTYCPRREVCLSPPLPDGVMDDGAW
jgi:hypothetical protein